MTSSEEIPDDGDLSEKDSPSDDLDTIVPEGISTLGSPASGRSDAGLSELDIQIDGYILHERLGEGGFGYVYRASQLTPVRREVALKILKPGMDSGDVLARFDAERQALAMMDHQNIAGVLDAGVTARGRPFFVMQLVKGIPLTKFCDRHPLPLKDRLVLFLSICRAIHHAHQKGIIHRDIKPSNILVSGDQGEHSAKVIDFGLAKAIQYQLGEETIFTAAGQVLGTPLYMSPEQASLNVVDVDIRSDVYSLGIVLYELLSGETPFSRDELRKLSFDEMLRQLREAEPAPPSSRIASSNLSAATSEATRSWRIESKIRGELDWIVMKAIEKDRSRRYGSASELADDVQRYLDGEPVAAGPPSRAYRAKKFAQKHFSLLVTAAILFIVLSVATATSTLWAIRALEAEKIADRRATAVQKEKDRADDEAEKATNLARASSLVAAQLAQKQAGQAFDKGDVIRGLHWHAKSILSAPEDEHRLRSISRLNLNAWSNLVLRPRIERLTTVPSTLDAMNFASCERVGDAWLLTGPDVPEDQPVRTMLKAIDEETLGTVYGLFSTENLQRIGQTIHVPNDPWFRWIDAKNRRLLVFSAQQQSQASSDSKLPQEITQQSLLMPNAVSVANGELEFSLWSFDSGKELIPPIHVNATVHKFTDSQSLNDSVQLDFESNQMLLLDYESQTVRRWSLTTGEPLGPEQPARDALLVDFESGPRFVRVDPDGNVQLSDPSSGETDVELRDRFPTDARRMFYSPAEGRLVCVTDEHEVVFFDMAGRQMGRKQLPGPVQSIGFGLDSCLITTTSQSVFHWDVKADSLELCFQSDDYVTTTVTSDRSLFAFQTEQEFEFWRPEDIGKAKPLAYVYDVPSTASSLYPPVQRGLIGGQAGVYGIQLRIGGYTFIDGDKGTRLLPEFYPNAIQNFCCQSNEPGSRILNTDDVGNVKLYQMDTGRMLGVPPLAYAGCGRIGQGFGSSPEDAMTLEIPIGQFGPLRTTYWNPITHGRSYKDLGIENPWLLVLNATGRIVIYPNSLYIATSPDETRLGIIDSIKKTITIRDVETGRLLSRKTLNAPGAWTGGQFSTELDRIVIVSDDGTACRAFQFDCATGATNGKGLQWKTNTMTLISPNANQLVAEDCLWDVVSGEKICELLQPHEIGELFSFDSVGRIAVSEFSGKIRFFGSDGKPFALGMSHIHKPSGISLISDGTQLLSITPRSTWGIWDVQSGKQLHRPVEVGASMVAGVLSLDERKLLINGGFRVQLWDVATRSKIGPSYPVTEQQLPQVALVGNDHLLKFSEGRLVLWPIARDVPMSDEQSLAWIEVLTRCRMDDQGELTGFTPEQLKRRVEQLQVLGGAPQGNVTPYPEVWRYDGSEADQPEDWPRVVEASN